MVSKVMMILDLLSDGRWHGTDELLLKLEVNERKFQEITAFLSKYGFVTIDGENRRMKINRDFKKLLVQTVA